MSKTTTTKTNQLPHTYVMIPAGELIIQHSYGQNYRDERGPLERHQLAEAIKDRGIPEPPWAIKVDGKFYHASGDNRLAAMLELGWAELPYRVVEPAQIRMKPSEVCAWLRSQSDLVKPLAFHEKVRMSRQLRSVYKSAKRVATQMHITEKYLKALWSLDGFLPAGWEERVGAEMAIKLAGLGPERGPGVYENFAKTGKFDPPRSENRATGRKAAKEAWVGELAHTVGPWVKKLPWEFISVPKGKREEFCKALDEVTTEILRDAEVENESDDS